MKLNVSSWLAVLNRDCDAIWRCDNGQQAQEASQSLTDADIETLVDQILSAHWENELGTISTCRAYLDAQLEYASADRDGDSVLEFAQDPER